MAKILHIMLTGPVTDGWGYQDNLLTKYHKRLGHEVTMITSQWVWGEDGKLTKCLKTNYRNENDVKVIRLPIQGKDRWGRKFKTFAGLYESMQAENPDILFVHNVSFPDMDVVVKYIRRRFRQDAALQKSRCREGKQEPGNEPADGSGRNRFTVYVDNHADLSNSGTNWVSRNILHKMIWRRKAKKIEPYTTKFFGVMPSRVDWLMQMYKLPEEKCELLVMGADDDGIKASRENDAGKKIREKYGITDGDFLIMTGGKIDQAKRQTLILMEAVRKLALENAAESSAASGGAEDAHPKVKLLVFGSVAPQLEEEMDRLADGNVVQFIGWIPANQSYDYFSAADLAAFPGRHSVYWEQVVGMEIPMLCKYWEGTTHVDIGGNVKFIKEDSVKAWQSSIRQLIENNKKEYLEMKQAAQSKKAREFSYLEIARKAT